MSTEKLWLNVAKSNGNTLGDNGKTRNLNTVLSKYCAYFYSFLELLYGF